MSDKFMDSDTRSFVAMMAKNSCNRTFVVFEECCTGLVQILTITNDFYKAYGKAMAHIMFCEEQIIGSPYIVEGELGIAICYGDEGEATPDESKSYIFIMEYNEDED